MADPADFSSVKLLLLGNGSNGATTFADSSSSARTVTGYGNAQISTAWSKYGGASIKFDGNGDYLTVADSADFDFGSGNWTIEFWYYRAVFGSGSRRLIGKREGSGSFRGPFSVQTDSSNYFTATFWNAAGTSYTISSSAVGLFALEENSYHVAIERSGNLFRLYIDGAVIGSVTITGAVYANSDPVCIGNNIAGLAGSTTASTGALGNLDDLRITKGEALYNGAFTPPASELPATAPTPQGRISLSGPLGAAMASGHVGVLARLAVAGPLGAPRLLADVDPVCMISVPGPLGGLALFADHDFTSVLESSGAVEFYVCDLVDGEMAVRVPVSSWQGTLQVDGSCYLQAVIPAVAGLADAINDLSDEAEFVISRGARLPAGATVEHEMGRSLVEQVQFDQGPHRYTCTMSGYSAAIAVPEASGPPLRILRGVRSISSGNSAGGSNARARCAIDWFLRPGCQALADATPLVASYINYYVEGRDAYMDVGERG